MVASLASNHEIIQHLEAYAVANPLVVQQSVEQIVTALPTDTQKFITINGGTKELYPCDSTEKNLYYVKSGTQKNFYHDIAEAAPMMMNEGYTVTHYSLQALYYLGCQTVYIVGMDHSFKQTGGPNQKQVMTGEDPNHFDPSYFQNHEVRKPVNHCHFACCACGACGACLRACLLTDTRIRML